MAARQILTDSVRLLTFRLSPAQFRTLDGRHLAFGLVCTWIAGMGRYWDNPKAELLQHLGVGSVVYVFALSLFLFLLIWPFRPAGWTYVKVLTFVSLTSPPAILYAIPVERFMTMDHAAEANLWFLAVVALWRVALLFWFLARVARLRWAEVIVATLLPLTLIVVALSALNLEHVVFNIMAGIEPEQRTANDSAYAVVWMLSMMSMLLGPILGLLYIILVLTRVVDRWSLREDQVLLARKTDEEE